MIANWPKCNWYYHSLTVSLIFFPICSYLGVVAKYSRRLINADLFANICETFPSIIEPLREMQMILRKKTLGIAKWKALTKKRWKMGSEVFVWRSDTEVLLHFGPRPIGWNSKAPTDPTGQDHAISTHSNHELCSPRPGHPSSHSQCGVDEQYIFDVDMSSLPWKAPSPIPSFAVISGILSASNDNSSLSDVKMRSRGSASSSRSGSLVAGSDISSLTNFSLALSGSDFGEAGSPSPKALVQISRHAKQLADSSAVLPTSQTHLIATRDGSEAAGGGTTSVCSSYNKSKSLANHHPAPSRPPIAAARAIMARGKIVPTDVSMDSSDEDTIDGAMGWTRGNRRRWCYLVDRTHSWKQYVHMSILVTNGYDLLILKLTYSYRSFSLSSSMWTNEFLAPVASRRYVNSVMLRTRTDMCWLRLHDGVSLWLDSLQVRQQKTKKMFRWRFYRQYAVVIFSWLLVEVKESIATGCCRFHADISELIYGTHHQSPKAAIINK